jgi:hypothetical protein
MSYLHIFFKILPYLKLFSSFATGYAVPSVPHYVRKYIEPVNFASVIIPARSPN